MVKPKEKKPRNFVLCPTCGSKSKKLYSEMGGVETRRCQKGHHFEKDRWMGGIIPARRVENIDRPFMVSGSYNDYVYGRFKDDPTGKGRKR
jgi:hypothetical protein